MQGAPRPKNEQMYTAGVRGSLHSMMYHGPGNIPEAVMAGKIAAKEKP